MSKEEQSPAQKQNDAFGIPETVQAPAKQETADQMRARIRAEVEAEVRAEAAVLVEPAVNDTLDSLGFPKKYVRLTVFEGNREHDSPHMTVSVNGYGFLIQRGKEVIVPHAVQVVLEGAVEGVTRQTKDGLSIRPAHRFPFTIHGEATEEEYLAFRNKMKVAGSTVAAA